MRLCQEVIQQDEVVSVGYTMGWGCVSWLHCGMRLCQLVTLWNEVVSVGYTVGWGCVSWLHSVMRLSVGYMMIAGSGSEGAAQWSYSTTKRSSGDCRRSAQLHHTAWHQHCMLVWRTPRQPPVIDPPPILSLTPPSPFIYLCHPPPPVPTTIPHFSVLVCFSLPPFLCLSPPPPPNFFCVGPFFIAHPSPHFSVGQSIYHWPHPITGISPSLFIPR